MVFWRKFGFLISGREGITASIQTLFVSVAILVVNLLTGLITARLLGPEGRGQMEAIKLWPSFLAQAFTLGIPSSLIFNLKKFPSQASELFTSSLIIASVAAAIALGSGLVFIPLGLRNYDAETVQLATLLMFFAPVQLLDMIYASSIRARGDFRLFNLIRWVRPLSTLVLLIFFALIHLLNPLTASLSYLSVSLPISVWLLIWLSKHYELVWKGLNSAFRKLISYGIRSYGIDLLGTLTGQLDKILVVGLLSPSSMGLYAVSLSLAGMLNIFQAATVTVLFPKASGRSTDEIVKMTGQAVRISTAATVLPALILGVFGPWVLSFLYRDEFREAATLMRLLLMTTVINGTNGVLAQAFMATNRPGIVTIFQSIGLMLSLPLLLTLIPRFGLLGAGLALLASSIVRFIFICVSFPKILHVPMPSLILEVADIQKVRSHLTMETKD